MMTEHNKGMTIIETVVGVGIIAIIALAATSTIFGSLRGQERERVVIETEWQATMLAETIVQRVRNATTIEMPSAGATSTVLELALDAVPGQDPTMFTYATTTVTMSENGGADSALTSSDVVVTSFEVMNINDVAVRVVIDVAYANPRQSPQLEHTTRRVITTMLR